MKISKEKNFLEHRNVRVEKCRGKNNNLGITLISLVITIIVLLILARCKLKHGIQ